MPHPDWRRALRRLRTEWATPAEEPQTLARRLEQLIALELDRLPRPAQGETLTRWATLADIAGLDLALIKLFEGHTDALAIIAELSDADRFPPEATWAVWAAEPPFARVEIIADEATTGPLPDRQRVRLNGRKAWCSGAATVSHALVTAWHEQIPYLAAVEMQTPGVRVTQTGWHAVGMAATQSVDVDFDGADAILVGPARGYLQRPGFWQGGIGIAACWWGAAARLGEILRASVAKRDDPHALAHLGAVELALRHGEARLREAASWIDEHPDADVRYLALSVRGAVDAVVEEVIHHVGRGVGAGPYCRDPAFARLVADLPVFVRQCHAERDLQAIGDYRRQDHKEISEWNLWP
ncbi:hypothetical protein ACS8E6_09075 [Salinicola halophyticus]|uniref:hypothetical protein n=1 Tax=Salinicola halophyticus TaxID=1808881 RepID=UPI003F45F29F